METKMYLRANPGGGRWCAFGLLVTAAMASVCPAWAQFAGSPPEGAATITQLTGRVDVMRDSTRWALSSGEWVRPGQLVITGPDAGTIFV